MGVDPRRALPVVGCVVALLASACQISSGTGLEDSTASLQAQIDALQPGGTLTLQPQTYAHHGVLVIRVPDVVIDGNGATLSATNDETSALKITADGVRVKNLTVTAPAEGKRWSGLDQQKIVIAGKHDQLSGITVAGSAAAGVFVSGAKEFELENVTVSGTRADGVHITGGSTNGRVDNVRTAQTGDDAVAVVSYGNEPPCQQIDIGNITVAGTRWGRGISVVGGRDVRIHDVSVSNTNSAGLYIAAEGAPYFTDSVESVDVDNGSITSANQDPDVVQGAVLVYSGNPGKAVQDVTVSGLVISGTPQSAGRNVGIVTDGGTVDAISLHGINIADSALPPLFSEAPAGSYVTSGWTVDGKPISAG